MSLRSRLSSAFKVFAAEEAAVAPAKGEVAIADLMTTSLFGKGGSWTVYNPSELISRRGYAIIDKMRNDEQIKAAMTFKKRTVNSSGWEVSSPEEEAEDWEVTEFVRGTLNGLRESLNSSINEMLLALDYGLSITEKIWDDRGGRLTIVDLKTRRPHNIYFDLDAYGNVTKLRQFNTELPVDKFIIYTHDKEFQNPYGTTDLSAAYRPWWSKDNAYKWLAILLEKMGIPPIFFFYNPESASGTGLTEMQNILKRLQAATVATIPRSKPDDVEAWAPELASNAANVFIPSIDMYDKHIAKALLMPGLLGFSADDGVGSLARSKTHFDSFMLVVNAIRQMVQEKVQKEVIVPVVDVNFMGVKRYPKFNLLPIDDSAKLEIYDAWTKLVVGKIVKATDDDEKHLRAAMKFPEREYIDGEREAANAPAAVPMIDDNKLLEKREFALDKTSKETKKIISKMDELETSLREELSKLVEGSRERIVKWVEKNYGKDDFDGSAYAAPSTLGALNPVKDVLLNASIFGSEMARESVSRAKNYAKATRPKQLPGESTKKALKYLKQKAQVVADKFDQKVQDSVRLALLTGLKTGDSTREVMRRVNEALDSVDEAYAENVVRTNITEAMNLGRLAEFRDPELSPFIAAVKYSSILDERTTEVCSLLHGKIFRVDDSALDELSPPNHFQCRAVLVPVLIDEQPGEDEFITEAEKGEARGLAGEGFV